MEEGTMAYPPDYKYLSVSDKHYVKNYGCTCIGIVVVVIILGVVASLPGILGGTMIMPGNPILNFISIMFWLAPFIVLGVVIKAVSDHQNRKEQEKMLADSEE